MSESVEFSVMQVSTQDLITFYTLEEERALGENPELNYWLGIFRVRIGRDAFPLRVLVARNELDDEKDLIRSAQIRAQAMLSVAASYTEKWKPEG